MSVVHSLLQDAATAGSSPKVTDAAPCVFLEVNGGERTFAASANRIRGLGVKQTLGFATVLLDQIHFTSEMFAHEYYAIRRLSSD
jgi:hypothetical protein